MRLYFSVMLSHVVTAKNAACPFFLDCNKKLAIFKKYKKLVYISFKKVNLIFPL